MSIWSDPTSAVPAAKTNAQTPTGAGTEWAAEDANKIRQALLDIGQGLASGSVTATGTTVGRSLGNQFADVVNVKDFGAVGAGVADDTGAIQAALNVALPTAKELFIPAGVLSPV